MSYFSKYVLSDNDIDSDDERVRAINKIEDEKVVDFLETLDTEMLYKGFDPQVDPWDRRLLYEVTGMRIDETDYRGDDTSSEEEED